MAKIAVHRRVPIIPKYLTASKDILDQTGAVLGVKPPQIIPTDIIN